MLNNIKNCTEKVRKLLVYLEVSLRITYLCTRFQTFREEITAKKDSPG